MAIEISCPRHGQIESLSRYNNSGQQRFRCIIEGSMRCKFLWVLSFILIGFTIVSCGPKTSTFIISGGVNAPGEYEVYESDSSLEALVKMADGFAPNADLYMLSRIDRPISPPRSISYPYQKVPH